LTTTTNKLVFTLIHSYWIQIHGCHITTVVIVVIWSWPCDESNVPYFFTKTN